LYLGVEMAFVGDAVEAFACFALEAAVNTYGVLRFGEDQFYSALERLPLKDKLKRAVKDGEGVTLEDSDEILQIVGRRVNSRDAIVHPKSHQYHPVTKKLISKTKVSPRPPIDRATDALADMNRFFQLLPALSEAVGPILELR